MLAIDSPAISDGLETWKKYYKDLENLPKRFQGDKMLLSAKKRAIWMINMFERYPNGLDISELSRAELTNIFKELEAETV